MVKGAEPQITYHFKDLYKKIIFRSPGRVYKRGLEFFRGSCRLLRVPLVQRPCNRLPSFDRVCKAFRNLGFRGLGFGFLVLKGLRVREHGPHTLAGFRERRD